MFPFLRDKKYAILFIFSVLLVSAGLFLSRPILAAGPTWTETRPAGDVDRLWQTEASSADGTKLIAGASGARLYISSDSGTSWTETQPAGAVNKLWQSVASSSDGTKLIVAANAGRLYISSDSGTSWTETGPTIGVNKGWIAVASSSDGTKLIAGDGSPGRLWLSSNSGVSWTETGPTIGVDNAWNTIVSNSDGTKLIAGIFNGRLYVSINSGTSWTETQPAGNANRAWSTLASSSDGTKVIAGVFSGLLYLSSNSGSSWTETGPTIGVSKVWDAVASSSDGTNLIAGNSGGRLYISGDSGASWTETQPVGAIDKLWRSTASNSNGRRLLAGISSGRLYIGSNNTAPTFTAISNTADSIQVGNAVTFTSTASDPDVGDTITLYVCRANDFTGTACGAGGEWTHSSTATTNPSATYTVQSGEGNGSHTYYASIIDGSNTQSGSNPLSGTFTTSVVTPPATTSGGGAAFYYVFSQNNQQGQPLSQPQGSLPPLATSPPPSPSYIFVRYLGFGDKGLDVLNLQKILAYLGFFQVGPTGYYGLATSSAVKQFQMLNDISPIGNVGPITKNTLNQLQGTLAIVENKITPDSSNALKQQLIQTIQQTIQKLLARMSY